MWQILIYGIYYMLICKYFVDIMQLFVTLHVLNDTIKGENRRD